MIYELSLAYSDNATSGLQISSLANVHNIAIEYGITPDQVRKFNATDFEFALINSQAKDMAQKRIQQRERMKAQAKGGRS